MSANKLRSKLKKKQQVPGNQIRREPPRISRTQIKKEKPAHYSSGKMKEILIQKFGLMCWGCDFKAPRIQYLQLDHMDPKSEGGSNALDNRALLCPPCNALKSNTMTLTGLRQENYRKGFTTVENHPIEISKARQWAKLYLSGKR